jgi:AraC-like DNA-binding protein
MKRAAIPSVASIRELARSGELRAAAQAARDALAATPRVEPGARVELHLVAAFCAMRQGNHADAHRELALAAEAASMPKGGSALALRVAAWQAELAYFEGRYSAALEATESLVDRLEAEGDPAHAAFAMRIRIAILLARADYDAIAAIAPRAIRLASRSRDDYVRVQVLNVLGAVAFDRATSKLGQPHARAHLPSIDPSDATAMKEDASEALRLFERARKVALRANYGFAAWYVEGNIERLEILLGNSARVLPAMRKRLETLQQRGARYDEIVMRSNLAWALRSLGRHRAALHELDVALELARDTSTYNVLLEFLHYDRSVVLDALGDSAGSRVAYRRYLRLAANPPAAAGMLPSPAPTRPLEPFFLKRADRYVAERIGQALAIEDLARHCGVRWKTLQKAFAAFRGITPVAPIRNTRLDAARAALDAGACVAEVAERFAFGSVTTFSLQYRKRFGVPPSRTKRRAAAR